MWSVCQTVSNTHVHTEEFLQKQMRYNISCDVFKHVTSDLFGYLMIMKYGVYKDTSLWLQSDFIHIALTLAQKIKASIVLTHHRFEYVFIKMYRFNEHFQKSICQKQKCKRCLQKTVNSTNDQKLIYSHEKRCILCLTLISINWMKSSEGFLTKMTSTFTFYILTCLSKDIYYLILVSVAWEL